MSNNVYICNGEILCEDCGARLKVDACEMVPDGGGESDTPQHCGMGSLCVNADWCPAHGKDGGHKVGMFLENPLTSDGYAYVEEACLESLRTGNGCVALEVWAPFYEISLPESDDLPKGE